MQRKLLQVMIFQYSGKLTQLQPAAQIGMPCFCQVTACGIETLLGIQHIQVDPLAARHTAPGCLNQTAR